MAVPACTISKRQDALKITAWKNRAAMLFTNNETATLSSCRLTLSGRDGVWQAEVKDRVAPTKTTIVPWYYFRTGNNLPMSRDRGVGGDTLVVTCSLGEDEPERSASFQL